LGHAYGCKAAILQQKGIKKEIGLANFIKMQIENNDLERL